MAKTHRDSNGRMRRYGFIAYRRFVTDKIGRESEREVEERHKVPNPDTEHRIEVQTTIENLLKDGLGKVEVLAYLNNKYPDSKLSKFFSSYIDNKIKYIKKTNKSKGISRDDEL